MVLKTHLVAYFKMVETVRTMLCDFILVEKLLSERVLVESSTVPWNDSI